MNAASTSSDRLATRDTANHTILFEQEPQTTPGIVSPKTATLTDGAGIDRPTN